MIMLVISDAATATAKERGWLQGNGWEVLNNGYSEEREKLEGWKYEREARATLIKMVKGEGRNEDRCRRLTKIGAG